MPTELRTRSHVTAAEALAAATVVLQVCYPLTSGSGRDALTVVTVLCFAAASLAHAAATRGLPAVAILLLIGTVCLGCELIGVRTGVPFGRYSYAAGLGPRLGGVPAAVAAAWMMMAWPCALAARRLVRSPVARVVVGGWALASWDLFLDPQMVAAGHWRWASPAPHLPGVEEVPLSNYAGWLVVAMVVSLVLQRYLGSTAAIDDAQPVALFLWTYASSVLALAAFLHLGAAAAWGAAGMGAVAVPLAVQLNAVQARGSRR